MIGNDWEKDYAESVAQSVTSHASPVGDEPREPVTVEALDRFVAEIFAQKRKIEEMEALVSVENKKLAEMESRAVMALEELGRKDYKSPHGNIGIQNKWRVNLPQSDGDKLALFEWMREQGIYDKYATVNSNALNSLYMAEWEAAKKRGEGMEFKMPGIGEAKLFKKLSTRKA